MKHITAEMKRIAALVGLVAGSVGAAGLPNSPGMLGELGENVGSGGDRSVSAPVAIGENALLKTGEGTLTVPADDLQSLSTTAFAVREGCLAVTDDAVTEDDVALSEELKAKLAFWFAADDVAGHLSGGVSLTAWYDVRETNVTSPSYPYAVSETTLSEGALPSLGDFVGEDGTYRAVSFGGIGSGERMYIKTKSGDAFMTAPKAAFAVYGVMDDQRGRIGHIFGGAARPNLPLFASGLWNNASTYFFETIWGPITGSRCWVDGNRIDPQTDRVRTGFHVLELEPNKFAGIANDFPYAIMSDSESASGKAVNGGEYVSELLWFSKELTESERLSVERYLQWKWFRGKRRVVNGNVSAGATLAVNVAAGSTLSNVEFTVAGKGEFVKSGEGTLALGHAAPTSDGQIPVEIQQGSVLFTRALPIVRAKSGRKMTSTSSGEGIEVTSSDASEPDAFVKDGDSNLIVGKVADDVSRIEVKAGRLVLTPAETTESDDEFGDVEVQIVNPGFERSGLASGFENNTANKVVRGCLDGWASQVEGKPDIYKGSNAVWYDYVKWNETGASEYGGPWSWYGWPKPPVGDCAVFMNNGSYMTTTVQVPKAGLYEFGFQMQTLGNGRGPYSGVRVTLRDEAGTIVTDFRSARSTGAGFYETKILRGVVPTAGTYTLWIQNYKYVNSSTWHGFSVIIDDLHMRRIRGGETEEWAIPNGDFECAELPEYDDKDSIDASYCAKFVNSDNEVWNLPGWTFPLAEGDALPAALLSAPWMTTFVGGRWSGNAYDNSRTPRGGDVELLFRDTASVSTSFTPPAGTHYLRASLADWATTVAGGSSSLAASVSIGGKTVSLGSVKALTKRLTDFTWPIPFTADGNTQVTLTLTLERKSQTGTVGMLADDFRLAKRYVERRNLLENGDFEDAVSGWETDGASGGSASIRNYVESSEDCGMSRASGRKFAELNGRAWIHRLLTFPVVGRYRISFLSHVHPGESASRLLVGLTKGSQNTTLMDDLVEGECFRRYESSFDVTSTGVHDLQFTGMGTSGCIDIDDIQIMPETRTFEPTCALSEKIRISVDTGAKLKLDFKGSIKAESVILGGRARGGVISAERYPAFIEGSGELVTDTLGLIITVR